MKIRINAFVWLLAICIGACHNDNIPPAPIEILYVGTFSVRNSEGIYGYRFDRPNRRFELLQTVSGPDSPSFLDISPDRKYLYSANRQGIEGDSINGSVLAYRIDAISGTLQLLNQSSSFGISPCHIYADAQRLYLSHYAGGSLSVLRREPDGSIGNLIDTVQHRGSGPKQNRQEAPHLHSIQTIPSTDLFLAADLGTDSVFVYHLEEDQVRKAMPPIAVSPGAGPRHFTRSADSRLLYVANELASSVTVYETDWPNKTVRNIQEIGTLPVATTADLQNSVADIHLSPDGRFLYVSNRGDDSLAIFAVDQETGKLSYLENQSVLGKTPRNFLIDPQGTFILVANENSDEIILFDRDPETGLLTPTKVRIAIPSPVSLQMVTL